MAVSIHNYLHELYIKTYFTHAKPLRSPKPIKFRLAESRATHTISPYILIETLGRQINTL